MNMEQSQGEPIYEDFTYGSPDPGSSFSDEQFRYLLNTNDDIAEFEKYIRGIEYDDQRNKWVRLRKPYLNEKGVNTLIGEMRIRCGRGINLSIMKKEEIVARSRSFSKRMNVLLNTRYDEFDLDPSLIPVIHGLIEDIVYANMTRSLEAFQQKMIGKIWKGGEVSRPDGMGGGFTPPGTSRIGNAMNRLLGK